MAELKKMSRTEAEIMNVIWDSDKDLCLQDIAKIFADRHWEIQTVSSFLIRLKKKGYLKAYRVGRTSYYQPIFSKLAYEQNRINNITEELFGTSLEGVVAIYCGKSKEGKETELIHIFIKGLMCS